MINLKKFVTKEEQKNCTFNELIKLYDLKPWKSILQKVLENINKIDNIDDKTLDVSIIEDKYNITLDLSILGSKSIIIKFDRENDDKLYINYLPWNNGDTTFVDLRSEIQINFIANIILNHIESTIVDEDIKNRALMY